MISINCTGILARRKVDSGAILANPNPEALHVFEEFRVEICHRLGVESYPRRRLALEGAVQMVGEGQGKPAQIFSGLHQKPVYLQHNLAA